MKLDFVGPDDNRFGEGTRVNLHFSDGTKQTRQLVNSRGFLSSVSNTLHFGLDDHLKVETMEVIWPDGKIQVVKDVNANQSLLLNYQFAAAVEKPSQIDDKLFTELETEYQHTDPYFNDYSLQVLLPHKLSQTGPCLATADVNGDGYDDLYLGGGHNQPGQILLGNKSGGFLAKAIPAFNKDQIYEDVGCAFFDADNDGDEDLYVASGSYEFREIPRLLVDRLYLNDGQGNFVKANGAIPQVGIAGSIVTTSDYDNDGDIDIFVGGRVVTGQYPYPASSLLLVNEGGQFSIQNDKLAPGFNKIGLVTDAQWTDIDGDKEIDLVLTGEWMGIEVFLNKNGTLVKTDKYKNLTEAVGWWNELLIADVDNDGDTDIVAGNLGLNYKFHASKEKPFEVFTSDFDYNGSADVILAKEYNGKQVPVRGKACMTQQLPHLKQKIASYNDFASRDLIGILGEEVKTALHYKATEFRSGIFKRTADDTFIFEPFENSVQTSPINSILHWDFDGDGINDLVLAGNNHQSEVETTRSDAGFGMFLKGNAENSFEYTSHLDSGLFADRDVRAMSLVKQGNNRLLFVANNNDKHQLYKVR